MCDCSVCTAHYKYHDKNPGWPAATDPVKLARYARAKTGGKIPADPAYATHVRACKAWGAKRVPEFSRDDLTGKSVKVYARAASEQERLLRSQPDRRFPGFEVTNVRDYVSDFEVLNNLRGEQR